MEMKVVNNLPALGSRIAREAVTTLAISRSLGQEPGDVDTAAHHRLVAGLEPRDRLHVSFRDDEQMHGCLGIEILEGQDKIVLVFDVRLGLAGHNPAEDAG